MAYTKKTKTVSTIVELVSDISVASTVIKPVSNTVASVDNTTVIKPSKTVKNTNVSSVINFPFINFDNDTNNYLYRLLEYFDKNLKTADYGRINGGSYQGLLELGYNSNEPWVKPLKTIYNDLFVTKQEHDTIINIFIAHGYSILHNLKL